MAKSQRFPASTISSLTQKKLNKKVFVVMFPSSITKTTFPITNYFLNAQISKKTYILVWLIKKIITSTKNTFLCTIKIKNRYSKQIKKNLRKT